MGAPAGNPRSEISRRRAFRGYGFRLRPRLTASFRFAHPYNPLRKFSKKIVSSTLYFFCGNCWIMKITNIDARRLFALIAEWECCHEGLKGDFYEIQIDYGIARNFCCDVVLAYILRDN
jgi:hypothetical protein